MVSDIDRERLCNADQANRDFLDLAQQLNINSRTARSIVLKFRRTGEMYRGERGGAVYSKVDEEIREALVRYVEIQPTITLKEMKTKFEVQFPNKPQICVQTISRTLDGQLISLKKLDFTPIQWNTDEVKMARRDFFSGWRLMVFVQILSFKMKRDLTCGLQEQEVALQSVNPQFEFLKVNAAET